jgi:16S rRNA (cytosine1402-N4)-methyltransferase
MREGPLDMRMDRSQGVSAAEWLREVSEKELAAVLWTFGEERFSRRIAKVVKEALGRGPVETTTQLARLIEEAGVRKEPGKHPATRSFQAIRIAVNEELDDLQRGLKDSLEGLATGGRLAVISFHSLEDRIVKRFFRDEERGWATGQRPAFQILGEEPGRLMRQGKSVRASALEVEANPRARSAILRVARKR